MNADDHLYPAATDLFRGSQVPTGSAGASCECDAHCMCEVCDVTLSRDLRFEQELADFDAYLASLLPADSDRAD